MRRRAFLRSFGGVGSGDNVDEASPKRTQSGELGRFGRFAESTKNYDV